MSSNSVKTSTFREGVQGEAACDSLVELLLPLSPVQEQVLLFL